MAPRKELKRHKQREPCCPGTPGQRGKEGRRKMCGYAGHHAWRTKMVSSGLPISGLWGLSELIDQSNILFLCSHLRPAWSLLCFPDLSNWEGKASRRQSSYRCTLQSALVHLGTVCVQRCVFLLSCFKFQQCESSSATTCRPFGSSSGQVAKVPRDVKTLPPGLTSRSQIQSRSNVRKSQTPGPKAQEPQEPQKPSPGASEVSLPTFLPRAASVHHL